MNSQTSSTRVMVIGVGTIERGDDAVGRLTARQISARQPDAPFDVLELHGEALALMNAWSKADAVILIDAISTGRTPGAVKRWDASAQPLPAEMACASTHDLGLCDAIELARAMSLLPDRVIVYGVEIEQVAHGSELSAPAQSGIQEAAAFVFDEANRLTKGRIHHA